MISPNWRNKISIKSEFKKKTSPELVSRLSKSLIIQLQDIHKAEFDNNLCPDDKYEVSYLLEDVINNFKFLDDLATGIIPRDEWKDYDFDGDFEILFNNYLDMIYDIGDMKVRTNKNTVEKFIWID